MRYFWIRYLVARWMPLTFAQWVNAERCSVIISNDPNGEWSVVIGKDFKGVARLSLGRAMLSALMVAESDTEFMWTSIYLRQWKPEHDSKMHDKDETRPECLNNDIFTPS